MLLRMKDKVDISVEEFNEYMQLKSCDVIFNNNLADMIFMSGLPLDYLLDMKLHEYYLDDSDTNYDMYIFKFKLLKKKRNIGSYSDESEITCQKTK